MKRSAVMLAISMGLCLPAVGLLAQGAGKARNVNEKVSWSFFADQNQQVSSRPANLHCSVIASDEDGAWVSLFLDAVPLTAVPRGVTCDSMRAYANTEYKLPSELRPHADVAQPVVFLSGGQKSNYLLIVGADGTMRYTGTNSTYFGETTSLGAVSATWFVPRGK